MLKYFIRLIFLLLFILSGGAFALSDLSDEVPMAQSPATAPIPATHFLANFANVALVDHFGRPFDPSSLNQHPVLFNFIFTHCGATCPMQTKALVKVYQALPAATRKLVRFVSISIDPTHDTPAQLHAFATRMGANLDNWFFLTGNATDIARLAGRLHIFGGDTTNIISISHPTSTTQKTNTKSTTSSLSSKINTTTNGSTNNPQIHRTRLWLMDAQGRMLQRYKGDPPDHQRLVSELTQVSKLATRAGD